jgi:hypothetical protein
LCGSANKTDPAAPYTREDWCFAVNLSALLGWLLVAAPAILSHFNPLLWLFAAVTGLPLAFVFCWICVAPLLRRIMRHPVSWARAAAWGAVVALAIVGGAVALGHLLGLEHAGASRFLLWILGEGSVMRAKDGSLTPYGWRVVLLSRGLFVIGGVGIALVLRACIGSGRGAMA